MFVLHDLHDGLHSAVGVYEVVLGVQHLRRGVLGGEAPRVARAALLREASEHALLVLLLLLWRALCTAALVVLFELGLVPQRVFHHLDPFTCSPPLRPRGYGIRDCFLGLNAALAMKDSDKTQQKPLRHQRICRRFKRVAQFVQLVCEQLDYRLSNTALG